jgi:excisionase family DNA binding protein
MPTDRATPARGDLLALGPASRLLGVDPDTLRRWADDGRVEVSVTPGGHRRFHRRSLERLLRAGPEERATLARLGGTPQRLTAAYRRTYRTARSDAPDAVRAVPVDDRAAWRETGRELVAELVRHLDAPDAEDRAAALTAASTISAALGERLARSGSSLTDAVTLFVAARGPFLAEIGTLGKRRALDSRQLADLFGAASSALDRCLLRFIDGHRSVPDHVERSGSGAPAAPASPRA